MSPHIPRVPDPYSYVQRYRHPQTYPIIVPEFEVKRLWFRTVPMSQTRLDLTLRAAKFSEANLRLFPTG